MSPTPTDPFGTARLRAAVLHAWRESPTRFTEDSNAEEDLRLGGYADRLFVELAQNAADAAAIAGVAGRLRVTVAGRELRVANTGAPLDAAGVAALASLRASAKRHGVTVGRFGVGFAATLAVSAEPRVVSRTGGVLFSADRTAEVVGGIPELAGQLAARGGEPKGHFGTHTAPKEPFGSLERAVPVLRLLWPVDADEEPVPDGFDTEVRLPLHDGVDPDALLAEIAAEVDDILLAMPVFDRIEVAGRGWTRSADGDVVEIATDDDELKRWLVHGTSGEFTADEAATLGIEAAQHPRWTVLWALPIDGAGVPLPLGDDVLHAPTPTDERLSLPARLIAAAPIEPSRRRVQAGPAVTAVLRAAAAAYPHLVRMLGADDRLAALPGHGFPLSEVDGMLHELIARQLTDEPWLPAARSASMDIDGDLAGRGDDLRGGQARVLDVRSPELVARLADVIPGLVAASGPAALRALTAVGAEKLSVADALADLAGARRADDWWRALYDELLLLVDAHTVPVDNLAGLGVPLLNGAVTVGPRGVLLPEWGNGEIADLLADVDVIGLRIASPDAGHPLLARLGAVPADALAVLDAPALQAAVERSAVDADAGLDAIPLARLVLHLVTATGASRGWLGALALPAEGGDVRRADELVLPGAPLLDVLDPAEVGGDGALAVLADDVAGAWSAEALTAVGVLRTFAVVEDLDPAGPDHDLPDERQWWESGDEPPRVAAVADLDLVADDAWPAALRLLASDPDTWRAVTEPAGHTGWWIARFALLGGDPPREWRMPNRAELAGLYDPVPDLGLPANVLAAAGVRDALVSGALDPEDAADLLERLGDPARDPHPGAVLRAYGQVAAAVRDPGDVDLPDTVRCLDGSVVAADRVAVLDQPWLLEIADPGLLVAGGDEPKAVAELLDLPLASGTVWARVASEGDPVAWADLAAVRAAADLIGVVLPDGVVRVHAELELTSGPQRVSARWWVDDEGDVHAADTEAGLARAFAHAAGCWERRHLVAQLLADPSASALLG